jgi:hypothetical protein
VPPALDRGGDLSGPTDLDILVDPWAEPTWGRFEGTPTSAGRPVLHVLLCTGLDAVTDKAVVVDTTGLEYASSDCWAVILGLLAQRESAAPTTLLIRATTRRRLKGLLRYGPSQAVLPAEVSGHGPLPRSPRVPELMHRRHHLWWRHAR